MVGRVGSAGSPRFHDYGLSAFSLHVAPELELSTEPGQVRTHIHLQTEMVFVERGTLVLEFAGTNQRITARELAVYWGGVPHGVVDADSAAVFHVAQLPVVDMLSWADAAASIDRLLCGQFLHQEVPLRQVTTDRRAFSRWSAELGSGDPQVRATVALELQARMRRFFHDVTPVRPAISTRPGAQTAAGVATAIRYVVRHFREHITIDDVARAASWHRDHLMASFRQICGLTVRQYLTRVRVAEAQRLLTTTDLPVLAICHQAGFSSTSRMYDAFHRNCDLTPAQYRHASRR